MPEEMSGATGRPDLERVGVLTPVRGPLRRRITLFDAITALGSDPSAAGVVIPSDGIAPLHARIAREHEEYVLIDLDTTQGTFVEGIPVVRCTLRDGDLVQIGRQQFYFGRLLQPARGLEGDGI